MEKMEKPVSNSPFSPFYAIGPPPSDIAKSASTPIGIYPCPQKSVKDLGVMSISDYQWSAHINQMPGGTKIDYFNSK